MMWGYGYGWGPFAMVGGIVDLIIWIVVIGIVISLLRGFLGRGRYRHYRHWGSSALDILEERYAKGEINKEEFEQKKRDLLS